MAKMTGLGKGLDALFSDTKYQNYLKKSKNLKGKKLNLSKLLK